MARPADAPEVEGFEILGLLGEGAMGAVYEAQQQEPQRRVALKLIRKGGLDPDRIRRLEMEVRALARLRHPGIVPLMSQGRAADGTPWFAMELVDGEPLDRFIARSSIDLGARIRLFQQVVAAVSHAHQNGVIHRDLKPGNILVSAPSHTSSIGAADRVGAVRVLDFGLARITDDMKDPALGGTEPGRIVGTLSYMSPEQARGEVDTVDQRTDIYSLGVILYELVTGKPPIDLDGCWVGEAVRRLTYQQPVRPRAIRRTPADLETIILKTLEKEPARRYQSAASLLEELDRWADGLPILAHPPSALYQLRKLAGRHQAVTAIGTLLLLLLVAAGPAYSLLQRRQARAIAEEKDAARAVIEFQKRMLTAPQPSIDGRTVLLRDLLRRSSRQLEREYRDQPKIEALLRGVVGRAFAAIGMREAARPELLRALELCETTFGKQDPRTEAARGDLLGID